MKKIALVLIAIAFAINFSYAQNTFPSSGNVGMGTMSPAELLDVIGNPTFGISTERLSMGSGNIGFNRRVATGSIYNSGAYAYQFQHTASSTQGADYLQLEVWNPSGGSINPQALVINGYGNVGIGTTSPGATLDVNGAQRLNGDLTFANDATSYFIHGPANGGAIRIRSNGSAATDRDLQFGNIDNNGGWTGYMTVGQAGNVGIGTLNPDQKLTVKGTIHSQEVIVDMGVLPDYVFKPAYHLPTLTEVKTYIDRNHHLPEMPSAGQVAKDGLSLGDMNAKLLKKVEELTLYLIEKNNKDKAKEAQLISLQKEIDELKAQVSTLIKPKP